MNISKEELKELSLKFHKNNFPGNGKIEIIPKVKIESILELSLAYTPGVAEVCKVILSGAPVEDYTIKNNLVAVVTDGSAILGLGNIGPLAGYPVMEGKSLLFKLFAGIDAIPILVNTQEVEKFVEVVSQISLTFGGINLEDISAPRCFEIEEKLAEKVDIPVFHDDQHGTAVVVLAGLINALKLVDKKFEEIKVVISGAGAAGIAIAKLLKEMNVPEIILVDSKGIIYKGRKEGMNPYKEEVAEYNINNLKGGIEEALKGADVFIGVSVAGLLNKKLIKKMAQDPVIFALANPVPEIMPDEAKEGGAKIVATGRSDFPNQINNVLGFPGIFRGLLDTGATRVTTSMKIAAAKAIASVVKEEELSEDYIIPSVFDIEVFAEEAEAVGKTAIEEGLAKIKREPGWIKENTLKILDFYRKFFATIFSLRKGES